MDGAQARAEQSKAANAGEDSPAVGSDGVEIAAGLSRREHDILAFERQWWKYAGSKEDAIKELFGMSATRYYQVLNALVDRQEAPGRGPDAGQAASQDAGEPPEGTRGTSAGL